MVREFRKIKKNNNICQLRIWRDKLDQTDWHSREKTEQKCLRTHFFINKFNK